MSFKFAFKGLGDLFRSQVNAKIHLGAALLCIGLGAYFQLSSIEWCFVTLSIFSVLAAEAFNTALEYLTDLVSPDFNELAGRTKDVAAAGVLLTTMGALGVGLFIFLPKFYHLYVELTVG
ncbi:MAG: diacylglycerol kinase family protein [Saprospiraceae bacterium]